MCSCGCQCGSCYQIVARCGQKVQSRSLHRITILQYTPDQGTSGLLGTSQRLVLQSGDTTLFVARRRILVNSLIVTLEIILEVIDQIYGLMEQFLVGTTVHQNGLCTEHLGNLGQDGGTALRDQQVGETSYQRVGGNTGQSVTAAALHTDDQLAYADGLSLELGSIINQALDHLYGICDLILVLLAYQEFHTVLIIIANVRL